MKGLIRSLNRGPIAQQHVVKQQFLIDGVDVTVTDGAPGFASVVLSALPKGNILYLGSVVNLTMTSLDANIIDAFEGDFALGMAPTVAGALTGNEANLTLSTAIPAGVAGVAGPMRAVGANTQNGTIFDNTDGTLEVNLNIAIDDASISADGDLQIDGDFHLAYTVLGDDDI